MFESPHHELAYAVYTPPAFDPSEELPLVVLLHGAGDDERCFDEASVGQHLDAEIRAGRVPRAVIAIPRGDFGFWENWADGSYAYRDWVMRGLIPKVATQYNTRPCPDGCHLMGISMGGHGALRFALLEPGQFSSVTVMSGPILDTEAALSFMQGGILSWVIPSRRIWGPPERERIERDDPFRRLMAPDDLGGLKLLLTWASRDHEQIIQTNKRFHLHLTGRKIPHEVVVFPGNHKWKSWKVALVQALRSQLAVRPGRLRAAPGFAPK